MRSKADKLGLIYLTGPKTKTSKMKKLKKQTEKLKNKLFLMEHVMMSCDQSCSSLIWGAAKLQLDALAVVQLILIKFQKDQLNSVMFPLFSGVVDTLQSDKKSFCSNFLLLSQNPTDMI